MKDLATGYELHLRDTTLGIRKADLYWTHTRDMQRIRTHVKRIAALSLGGLQRKARRRAYRHSNSQNTPITTWYLHGSGTWRDRANTLDKA